MREIAVHPGDHVKFRDEDGRVRSGKVVMRSEFGGWVLNLGGRYGTPAVVSEEQIVKTRSPRRNPYDLFEMEEVSPVGWSHRPLRSNPELLIVGANPMRRKRRMARKRRRNSPVTVKIGRKKHTWKALVRKHGVTKASKLWKRGKKFHGYSRDRVILGRRRKGRKRRKSRNSWRGNRRGHCRAAKKGWRKRRRRRKSSKRSRAAKRGWSKRRRRKGKRRKARNRRRRSFRRR